jgi:hypothetical protein
VVSDDYRCALAGKKARRGGANSAAPARDHSYLAAQRGTSRLGHDAPIV